MGPASSTWVEAPGAPGRVDDADRASPASRPLHLVARAWSARRWAHAAALALILLFVMPMLGTAASFSADEGAAIHQARSLAEGGGWDVEHPLAEVDPDHRGYPLELSERGTRAVAPFAKHPLYAVVLAGAYRAGGVVPLVLLSVGGSVAAAVMASVLAGAIRPGLTRPTLWAVGLASPLFLDGYLVIAHTLGAALVAAAVVLVMGDGQARLRVAGGRFGLAVVCCSLAVLFRTEAVLFGFALGAVLATRGVLRRRPSLVGAGVAVTAAVSLTRLLERAWVERIVGSALPTSAVPTGEPGFFSARVQGFVTTVVAPAYGSIEWDRALLLAGAVCTAVLAGLVARRPDGYRGLVVVGFLAVACAAVPVVGSADDPVPGLMPAFPLLVFGVAQLRPIDLHHRVARTAVAVSALFAAMVMMTQYAVGGGVEWGGRYLALAIPVLVPVALAATARALAALSPRSRRAVLAVLVVSSVCSTGLAIRVVRSGHARSSAHVAAVDAFSRVVLASGGGRPVIVSTDPSLARFAWSTYERQRWLLVEPDDLATYDGRLRRAGIDALTLATTDPIGMSRRLPSYATVRSTRASPGSPLTLVELRGR